MFLVLNHPICHPGRQVQAEVEELLRHVALLERDCQASLAKISFHIFLAKSKIQIVFKSFLPGFLCLFGRHGICTNSLRIFLVRLLPGQVELMHTHTTPMIYYILQVTKTKTTTKTKTKAISMIYYILQQKRQMNIDIYIHPCL